MAEFTCYLNNIHPEQVGYRRYRLIDKASGKQVNLAYDTALASSEDYRNKIDAILLSVYNSANLFPDLLTVHGEDDIYIQGDIASENETEILLYCNTMLRYAVRFNRPIWLRQMDVTESEAYTGEWKTDMPEQFDTYLDNGILRDKTSNYEVHVLFRDDLRRKQMDFLVHHVAEHPERYGDFDRSSRSGIRIQGMVVGWNTYQVFLYDDDMLQYFPWNGYNRTE